MSRRHAKVGEPTTPAAPAGGRWGLVGRGSSLGAGAERVWLHPWLLPSSLSLLPGYYDMRFSLSSTIHCVVSVLESIEHELKLLKLWAK